MHGTWSKRGYTANHCIGFVISAATGRVLDFEVISKLCQQCTQMKAKLDEAGFNDWYQDHICEGSYKGSSPGMEMECAKRLWGQSENNCVRYKWMICDGDSKSYNATWSVYGACDTCHKHEAMEQSDKELIAWKNSQEHKTWEEDHLQGKAECERVIKLDCIGQVQKRLGKALYEFQSSSTKLSNGKPMKGRDGRLTKKAIEKLKKNYGKAVRNNVNRNIALTSERDSAVKKMQVEIKAGLYHCLKISNQERHKYCPVNSWCKFKKGLPCPNKPHHLDGVFKEPLEKIYDRLSEPALHIRCLPEYSQNANESVNALAWNKCPKHKWHGRNRIVMAASSAALHFSCGVACKQALCLGKKIARKGKGRGERACRQTFEAAILPSCNYLAEHLSVRSLSVNQFRA